MSSIVRVVVNGRTVEVSAETTAAAAVMIAGQAGFRTSVAGERRAPLCGMGVCYECRVTIDGVPHVKSCRTLCRDGMRIETT